jgi:hypothetical protein
MLSVARLRLPEPRDIAPPAAVETARMPPFMAVAAGGLSGRPRCRIFPVGRLWVLQMEIPSGWLLGEERVEPPPRLTFPTLGAAVAHAELHGFDYRIITPSPVTRMPCRGRVPTRDDRRGMPRPASGHNNMEP